MDYKSNPPLVVLDKPNLNKFWLIGFTEAEGSFCLVNKTSDRIAHGFALTKKDRDVLEEIRLILNIKPLVRWNRKGFWVLDATGKDDIKKIKDYYFKCFKGVTSLYYRIWARSFRDKGKYSKLLSVKNHLRKLKN